MSKDPRSSRGAGVLVGLGVALLYVACAKLGLALAFRAAQVTAVWPPTAFALVAVWLFGRRAVPGVLLGAFIANATAGEPLWVAAGVAIGNTAEALTGVWLLRLASFDARLARVHDVIALLGALAVSPVVAATLGVASLTAGGVQPMTSAPALWWLWWIGDALGGLIFAPLLFVWSHRERLRQRSGSLIEGALLMLGVVAASMFVFLRLPHVIAAEYVVFPFLIWAALRFGPAGSATAAVAANAIAVWGTHAGVGPFAGAGPEQGLVLLQIFMAVAATTALFLGAISAQNRSSQERAEHSERRLLMAMGGARVAVWDWNLDSGELLWSEGIEPLRRTPSGRFASSTYDAYRKLIHPDDLERVEAAVAHAIETRTPYEAQFRIIAADGVVRWTDARGTVLADESGRAVRMIGVGIDVTRQKELEEQLRTHDRRKDEFLAMLAHELRNPLAPILHATNLLTSSEDGDAEEARQVIRRQTLHLARLVDDLLDVSRITRGSVHLDRRPVTLAEIVNAAVDMWRHLIAQKQQRLSIDIVEPPVWLDADPTRLTQAIANLVHNAAKFTPADGRIEVTAGEEEGVAVVRVRDSGQGMSEDVLAHAFEMFVQGPPPLDRPHGGLGLGLTLVRRLVGLHGGAVEASSKGAGRGSEFVVRLPVAPAPVAKASVASAAPAKRRARRVLLVEDHADARRILALMLKRDGHDVRTAADGPSAVAEAKEFAPEIVLLDIGLPGMDGYAVARQLRALPQCDGARLIALTGYGQPEDRELSRAAGFDEYLLKPVEPASLLAMLGE